MSTKSTIAFGDIFHLYEECFDFDGLYLELNGTNLEFEIVPNRVTIKIPDHVLEAILAKSEVVEDAVRKHKERKSSTNGAW